MFDFFLAQMLVVMMLLASLLRVFFISHSKIDFLAFLSPVALLISLVIFYIWGAEFSTIILLCISAFVTFTNIRSLIRLNSRLFVDHYNLPFIGGTVIQIVLCIIFIFFSVKYHPVRYSAAECGAGVSRQMLSGSIKDGFALKDELFNGGMQSGTLYRYYPLEKKRSEFKYEPVFLFVSSSTGPVVNYEPYFLMIAQRGYTVYAADFFDSEDGVLEGFRNNRIFKKQYMTKVYFSDQEEYTKLRRKELENLVTEYRELAEIVLNLEGADAKLYFVTDGIGYDEIQKIFENTAENTTGFFSLNTINEYKTPGFGFIEMNDIYHARKFGLDRDTMFFIPRYAAGKTIESAEKLLPRKSELTVEVEKLEELCPKSPEIVKTYEESLKEIDRYKTEEKNESSRN